MHSAPFHTVGTTTYKNTYKNINYSLDCNGKKLETIWSAISRRVDERLVAVVLPSGILRHSENESIQAPGTNSGTKWA